MLFIDGAHQGCGRRENLIYEDKDGLFRGQLDAFANDIDELADGKIGGNQVFLLVDGRDIGLLDFFTDHRDTVGVLLPDAFSFGFSLLKVVLVLEL